MKARTSESAFTPNHVKNFKGAWDTPLFAEHWMLTSRDPGAPVRKQAEASGVVIRNIRADLARVVAGDAPPRISDAARAARNAEQNTAVRLVVDTLRSSGADPAAYVGWTACDPRVATPPHQPGRARLILPCGSGKTRVSARVACELAGDGDIVVVLAPSIALLPQIQHEYAQVFKTAGRLYRSILVCSDATANRRAADDRTDREDPTRDDGAMRAADLESWHVESADQVRAKLVAPGGERTLTLVLSTYQSAHHTAEGLMQAGRYAELLVCDEAHRTAQLKRQAGKGRAARLENFIRCHDQKLFPARYRLYQTATPRVYDSAHPKLLRAVDKHPERWRVHSMDDEAIFGPEAHRLSYRDAVEKGILCDYRIIAFGTDRQLWDEAADIAERYVGDAHSKPLTTEEALSWLLYALLLSGAVTAEGGRPVAGRRSLAFLSRIQRSEKMAEWLKSEAAWGAPAVCRKWFVRKNLPHEPRRFDIVHLDARHSVAQRREQLQRLAADGDDAFGITNVGIFGEGTDSPSLDAVAILTPKSSPTEIVQIVGRAMRLAPAKDRGYIVLPVPLPRGLDAETSLAKGELGPEWEAVGKTLQALAAHDDRVADERLAALMQIYVPPDDDQEVVQLIVTHEADLTHLGAVKARRGEMENVLADARDKRGLKPSTEQNLGDGSVKLREAIAVQANTAFVSLGSDPQRAVAKLEAELAGVDVQASLSEFPVVTLAERTRSQPVTWRVVDSDRNERGEPDVARSLAKAVEHARKRDGKPWPRPVRRDRRRPRPSGPGVHEQRLFEELMSGDVGRALSVEVMERSGILNTPERNENLLREPVLWAARYLREENLEPPLRGMLQMPLSGEGTAGRHEADACTRTAVILLNALILHARLEETDTRAGAAAQKAPTNVIAKSGTAAAAMTIAAWHEILQIDYQPLFQPACDALTGLTTLGRPNGVNQAVRRLAAWAHEHAVHYAHLGADHAGPLFAKVMGSQQSDGAFFTMDGPAALLAELALDATGIVEWKADGLQETLRAVDPACGSGALLMALIEAGQRRVRAAGGRQAAARFHRAAVEDMVCGLDQNAVSLQLAATRLTLGAMDADYRRINLHRMPYGAPSPDQPMKAGSLELLARGSRGDDLLAAASSRDELVERIRADLEGRTDIVIMNPPYSNNTKDGQKLGSEQPRFQKRKLAIRDGIRSAGDSEAAGAVDANSIRTFFSPLADGLLKHDHGVLAKALPTTACTGESGVDERRFLAERFDIRYIITSHDPKNLNISADVNINESLLVATRPTGGAQRAPTVFVNLRAQPRTADEGREIAQAIAAGRYGEVGNATLWPANRLQQGDWRPAQWYDPVLAEAAWELEQHGDLVRTDQLYEFGPVGRTATDVFIACAPRDEPSIEIFETIDSNQVQTINARGAPYRDRTDRELRRAQKVDLPDRYRSRGGWALLAHRFGTTSTRVTAVCAAERSLGTAFMPVQTNNRDEAKVLVLLWNSTPVLLQLLNNRSKKLSYPKWSRAQLGAIRLPGVARSWPVIADAVRVFAELEDVVLDSLRDAPDDVVRHELDRFAAPLFGVSAQRVRELQERLALEPFVYNEVHA